MAMCLLHETVIMSVAGFDLDGIAKLTFWPSAFLSPALVPES